MDLKFAWEKNAIFPLPQPFRISYYIIILHILLLYGWIPINTDTWILFYNQFLPQLAMAYFIYLN